MAEVARPDGIDFVSIVTPNPSVITRGGAGSGPQAAAVSRISPGHPERCLEGLANIYNSITDAIEAGRAGNPPPPKPTPLPKIQAVLDGNSCMTSSANNAAWAKL